MATTSTHVAPHGPRRKKSARERREQQQRSDTRSMLKLIKGLSLVACHRGSALGRLGEIVQRAARKLESADRKSGNVDAGGQDVGVESISVGHPGADDGQVARLAPPPPPPPPPREGISMTAPPTPDPGPPPARVSNSAASRTTDRPEVAGLRACLLPPQTPCPPPLVPYPTAPPPPPPPPPPPVSVRWHGEDEFLAARERLLQR